MHEQKQFCGGFQLQVCNKVSNFQESACTSMTLILVIMAVKKH